MDGNVRDSVRFVMMIEDKERIERKEMLLMLLCKWEEKRKELKEGEEKTNNNE